MSNLLLLKKEVLSQCAFHETCWQDLCSGFHAEAAGRQRPQNNLIQALNTQVL